MEVPGVGECAVNDGTSQFAVDNTHLSTPREAQNATRYLEAGFYEQIVLYSLFKPGLKISSKSVASGSDTQKGVIFNWPYRIQESTTFSSLTGGDQYLRKPAARRAPIIDPCMRMFR